MAVKAYEPKVGNEGVVIETFVPIQVAVDEEGKVLHDRKAGESFVVGGDDKPWPYATENPGEQAFLDEHPLVKSVAANQAESADPEAKKTLEERASRNRGGES